MKLNSNEITIANDKLKEIAEILLHDNSKASTFNLMGGKIGHALFFYYYYKYTKQKIFLEKCIDIISEKINIFNQFENSNIFFSFADGLSGFGWLLDHFNRNGEIDFENNDFFSKLSDVLFKKMKHLLDTNDFDYLYGATGICWYFIKTNHQNINDEKIKYYLDCMQNKATYIGNTCCWKKNNEDNADLKEINLGLAHGIPAIMIILSEISKIESLKIEALRILKPAIYFLADYKQDNLLYGSFYPYVYDFHDLKIINPNNKSRLAWCYGDLSVSWALLKGGIACNDEKIVDFAKEIILSCTKRRDIKEELVLDAIVCHGYAGIALLFKKFLIDIHHVEIEDAAKFWLSTTLSNNNTFQKYLRYNTYLNDYQENHSLLNGIAGIGLVLLSFISENEIYWDECLLLR